MCVGAGQGMCVGVGQGMCVLGRHREERKAYHLQICTHPRKGPLRGVEGKGVCVRLPRRKSGQGKGCVWE